MKVEKRGRPKKAQSGRNLWIPAHLVWAVAALLEADKRYVRVVGASSQKVESWPP